MRLRPLLALFLFIVAIKGYAQNDLGAWYIYNGSFFTKPSAELFFETQVRLRSPLSNKEEIFFRPIFIHHFNSTWNAGLGYSFGINFDDAQVSANDKSSHEHRIILQGTMNTPVQRTRLQHRFRLEQRWITAANSSESNSKQRFRYRLQATIPIGNTKIEKGVFFVNFYNELFLNIENGFSFDQNRLYGASGYQFTPSTNLQVGYLFQIKGDEHLHRLQFFVTQRLYFHKNE